MFFVEAVMYVEKKNSFPVGNILEAAGMNQRKMITFKDSEGARHWGFMERQTTEGVGTEYGYDIVKQREILVKLIENHYDLTEKGTIVLHEDEWDTVHDPYMVAQWVLTIQPHGDYCSYA